MRSVGTHKSRVVSVGAALGMAVATLAVVAPAAQAGPSTCQAKNLTTGAVANPDLQVVIDAASPGDRIQVKGVCVGNFTIDKDLTVVGKATQETPKATLDGNDAGRVLSVSSLTGAGRTQVTLTNLKITHGIGGIYSVDSAVTLTGSTSVTGNTKPRGAGIDNLRQDHLERFRPRLAETTALWRRDSATMARSA